MTAPPGRWYREPMVWLLVALPLASVVATLALLRIGGAGPPLDAVPDDVRRSAQIQQADLAPDERALALGLSAPARLRRDDAGGMALSIDARALPAGETALHLVHPLVAGRDRVLSLRREGDTLVADGFDPSVAWRLRLVPASGEWRLVARWDPARTGDATADPEARTGVDVVLRPALGGGP